MARPFKLRGQTRYRDWRRAERFGIGRSPERKRGGSRVLVRQPKVHWLGWKERLQSLGPISKLLFSPSDVGPAGISRLVALPNVLSKFPRGLQDDLRVLSIRPAGARWLVARLKGVPLALGKSVVSAAPFGDKIGLTLNDHTERVVDHVLLGTGYRINVARYPFLDSKLLRALQLAGGFPKLGPGLESSVPGLHFLGAPAGWSCGPLLYFVSGTKFAAQTLVRHIASRKG
jgi:FAD-dependent urate hydroxylase